MASLSITRKLENFSCIEEVSRAMVLGGETDRPAAQRLWKVFDSAVLQPFLEAWPVDKETLSDGSEANTALKRRQQQANEERLRPPVVYETEFYDRDGILRPCNKPLTGLLLENKFLFEVEQFIGSFTRHGSYVLVGIEEPRLAARNFSAVNRFTLGDNIKIDVERGELYTENRTSGGWSLIYSDLCVCRSTQFEAVSCLLNGATKSLPKTDTPSITVEASIFVDPSIAGNEIFENDPIINPQSYAPRKNTVAGQKSCEIWLAEYAAGYQNGSREHIPRHKLETEALNIFGISKKAFSRAWGNVSGESPSLRKPGRRRAV